MQIYDQFPISDRPRRKFSERRKHEMSVYASAKSSVGTFCQDKAALVSRIPADRYGKLSISLLFELKNMSYI